MGHYEAVQTATMKRVLAMQLAEAMKERNLTKVDSSELAGCPLPAPQESSSVEEGKAVYGLRPIRARGGIVTNELIDMLRDDDAC